jgi:hypothetical protein
LKEEFRDIIMGFTFAPQNIEGNEPHGGLGPLTFVPRTVHLLWRFENSLPSLYNLIESSPNDQNTLKLFLSIKHTNTYISSYKFVLDR